MTDNWSIHPADLEAQERLSRALGLERTTSQVLINRGFSEVSSAESFLDPKLSSLPDPMLFPDMEKAVERITAAIREKEKIALYGDYDVDGITAVALLSRFLRSVGHDPIAFIPNRLAEGYGLHEAALRELNDKGASLIITVDCGTRSNDEVRFARSLGMEVIVTDHHEVGDIPADFILLNPKRCDHPLGDKEMAGCGVAFCLLTALRKRMGLEPAPEEHLDLVALGTIADVVPLTGVNRIFAKFGMKLAGNSAKPGVRSLISSCGLEGQPLKTGSIAFRLAPRINAAGRMGDATPSLELLTTDDEGTAREIASTLNRLNAERQAIEEKALIEAVAHIERERLGERSSIVVADKKWHAGVIGIVASKLVDRYRLPSVVISSTGKRSKGSARSVSGVNIVDVLGKCRDVLERFGGHAQAAGLLVDSERIADFRERFDSCCSDILPKLAGERTSIDAVVEAGEISRKLAKELERLEPFGLGNPEPVLLMHDLTVASHRVVGTNHLKLRLACKRTGCHFDAIAFGQGGTALEAGKTVSIAFTPQINIWNGYESVQLKVKEIVCSK